MWPQEVKIYSFGKKEKSQWSPPKLMDRCDGKAKEWEQFRDPRAMRTSTDKEYFERRT